MPQNPDYGELILTTVLLVAWFVREIVKRVTQNSDDQKELRYVGAHAELAAPLAKVIGDLSDRLDETTRLLGETRIKLDECLLKTTKEMSAMNERIVVVENGGKPKPRRLTADERKKRDKKIREMKKRGTDKAVIAQKVGCHISTVTRVLKAAA